MVVQRLRSPYVAIQNIFICVMYSLKDCVLLRPFQEIKWQLNRKAHNTHECR